MSADLFHRLSRMLLLYLLFIGVEARAQGMRDPLLGVWNNTALPDTHRIAAAHRSVWRVYLHRAPDTARYYAQHLGQPGREPDPAGPHGRGDGSRREGAGERKRGE
ncbi:MAG: hypothetical protein IPP83_09320 [Flavobacteriales bacterium]|nr:hypothetical protein [Flavobacteriales bacterium]